MPSKFAEILFNDPCFVKQKNPVVLEESPKPSEPYKNVNGILISGLFSSGLLLFNVIGTNSIGNDVPETFIEYGKTVVPVDDNGLLFKEYNSNKISPN